MKILHIFPYLPTPPTFGGALRVYHILKHLHQYHDVTVAGFMEYGDLHLFRKAFPELKGDMHFINRPQAKFRRSMQLYAYFTGRSYWSLWSQSKRLEKNLNQLLLRNDFDIIQAEFSSMGHFNLESGATRIVDAHNVEHENFRRMSSLDDWSGIRKHFYQREFEKSYHEEINALKKQDAIFVTSKIDGELIKRDVPEVRQFVIPNGVDTDYFQPEVTDIEPHSMVFTGAMGYVPNYDGIIGFLNEIFPLIKKSTPDAKIYIVGNNPPAILKKFESESVIITGFVDDVRPYINRASVFVVPLSMGSGTRLKVVEALSMQKPVVSTSIGCEGIDVVDGEHLLIRDNPESFADAVLQLFSDQKARKTLTDNGYELAKSNYDWNVIGHKIEEAFQVIALNSTPIEEPYVHIKSVSE